MHKENNKRRQSRKKQKAKQKRNPKQSARSNPLYQPNDEIEVGYAADIPNGKPSRIIAAAAADIAGAAAGNLGGSNGRLAQLGEDQLDSETQYLRTKYKIHPLIPVLTAKVNKIEKKLEDIYSELDKSRERKRVINETAEALVPFMPEYGKEYHELHELLEEKSMLSEACGHMILDQLSLLRRLAKAKFDLKMVNKRKKPRDSCDRELKKVLARLSSLRYRNLLQRQAQSIICADRLICLSKEDILTSSRMMIARGVRENFNVKARLEILRTYFPDIYEYHGGIPFPLEGSVEKLRTCVAIDTGLRSSFPNFDEMIEFFKGGTRSEYSCGCSN